MSSITQTHENQQYDPRDRNILLGLLFSHKIKLIVEMLRRRDIRIRRRITESDLRSQVEELLDDGEISLGVIVEILNELEGWGRQQIYLMKFNGGQTLKHQWLDRSWVENHMREQRLLDIFNITRPIATPDEPTLISIEYSEVEQRIRFVWVQKRTTVERDEDSDPPPDEFHFGRNSSLERIIYKAYREITVRGIISFDWDIRSDEAMIMIRKLTGTDYAKVRDEILAELTPILPILDFHMQSISAVITRLDRNDEVTRKSLEYKTVNNAGRLSVSSGNQQDVFADDVLEQARTEIINDVTGLSGNIKWKVTSKKHITIELYGKKADDQRIGISAQELQEDIRYVLRRIRTYCT